MTKGLKKVDLAHALGVDPSLITRYTERGMPTISVAAALDWKLKNVRPRVKVANIENPGLFDYDHARAKREHFAALQAEAAARKELGQLIEVEKVEHAFSKLGTAIRLTLEALPTTVGPHLVGLDESQMVATLSYEVEKILYEMSATAAAFANAEARGC